MYATTKSWREGFSRKSSTVPCAARHFIRRQIAVCHFYVCKPRRRGGWKRVIKERRGALARNKPASKKVANRMSYVGGVRESRRGWRNWKHMGALAFPFFPCFPPFSSFLSLAISPLRGRSCQRNRDFYVIPPCWYALDFVYKGIFP